MDIERIRDWALGAMELGAVAAFMAAVYVWADAVMRV